MLGKTKFDDIETLGFQALIDMEISHEELNTIIRLKKHKTMKENLININEEQENWRVNSVN